MAEICDKYSDARWPASSRGFAKYVYWSAFASQADASIKLWDSVPCSFDENNKKNSVDSVMPPPGENDLVLHIGTMTRPFFVSVQYKGRLTISISLWGFSDWTSLLYLLTIGWHPWLVHPNRTSRHRDE